MIEPAPYFTFCQVAEKWASETNKPVMDVIQIMRAKSTYGTHSSPNSSFPPLQIWPTACFSPQGDVNEITIFNSSQLVEKDHCESVNGVKPTSKFRSKLYTPEYKAALEFLNSAISPPSLTDEIKYHLSLFTIRREDFENWCRSEEEPLPRFWFPSDAPDPITCANISIKKTNNLPDWKGKTIPKAKRRKPEDFTKVIDSLFIQLQKEGNNEVIKPRQVDAFLKCLKDRTKDLSKLENSIISYGELIKEVKTGNPSECVLMQKPRIVRGEKCRENKWYSRKDVGKRLSELRKDYTRCSSFYLLTGTDVAL
jgi:hypothetical protein